MEKPAVLAITCQVEHTSMNGFLYNGILWQYAKGGFKGTKESIGPKRSFLGENTEFKSKMLLNG